MRALHVDVGMDLPCLPGDHGVPRLVQVGLERRGRKPMMNDQTQLWDAPFFGLDAVSAFRDAGPDARERILARAGQTLVEEAFFIERAGIAFASKMALMAESIDERQLYGMFASDEASHFALVAPFVSDPSLDAYRGNGFLCLLDELIKDGTRPALQVLVQVVLEGWGLTHYRAMRDACRNVGLRSALSVILADEAAHHGSGVLLTQDAPLSPDDAAFVRDALERMLGFVRLGPQAVLGALERELGAFTRAERLKTLHELRAEQGAQERLSLLADLIGKSQAARSVLADLTGQGAFVSLSAEQLA